MHLLQQLSDEISGIIEAAAPSIVEVQASYVRKRRRGGRRYAEEDSTVGAGVILNSDGIVVTNHHVIKGSDRVGVLLPDHRSFEPEVLGSDPTSDVAVLRLPARDLTVPRFQPDRRPRRGELVFALGSPFGFTSSACMGIVSDPARFEIGPSGPALYIQTDIPINEGHSGGALVGCDGAVIGLNAWAVEDSQGLAFSIPISRVIKIAQKLVQDGTVYYGNIGASGSEFALPADIVRTHGISQSTAFLVEMIDSKGPAARAGIRRDDWIISIDGCPVDTVEAFLDAMDGDRADREVPIRIIRGLGGSLADRTIKIEKVPTSGARKNSRRRY